MSIFPRCVTVLSLVFAMAAFAAPQKGQMKDPRDGKIYKTVKIGEQTWMAENLVYDFKDFQKSSFLVMDDKPLTGYYSWEAAKKACPKGWHLPSRDEWLTLMEEAGGSVAGKNLKSESGLLAGNGVDKYGFAVYLFGGAVSRDGKDDYAAMGQMAFFWSSTAMSHSTSWGVLFFGDNDQYGFDGAIPSKPNNGAVMKQTVRCIADK